MQSTNECILPCRLVDLRFDPESLEIYKQRLRSLRKFFSGNFVKIVRLLERIFKRIFSGSFLC